MSVNSSDSFSLYCMDSNFGYLIIGGFAITKLIFLLPLSVLIVHVARQQRRSCASASHSDIFVYHVTAVEWVSILGTGLFFCGDQMGDLAIAKMGTYMSSVGVPGQILFHILTCVERYMAVVYPITYLGLRRGGGVRIRNGSVGCVWLLCLGWMGLTALYLPKPAYIPLFFLLVVTMVVVSFCCARVLCVLIRPSPGDVGGNRKCVDQSKQRAFNTMAAITGVVWFYFAGFLVCLALNNSALLAYRNSCLVLVTVMWLSLPETFLLPLMFLHRSRNLLRFHCSSK